MKPFALFLILVYSVTAAPNWVPPQNAAAYDRIMQDSKTYEVILRSDYEVVGCDVEKDSVRIRIRRATLAGDLYENVQADKCTFEKNRYQITQKPIETPFPWKEVLITAVLSIAAGFAAGAGIGK